ncbi:hypothetical protein DPMN_083559 [Dreissena polymorpha]|uniref:Uncharacterized protein n=1 Tax=Dreissena polymorpha TaxID=45954 RepID=A0A9D4BB79_DREPO|nr:hypothetical protein DPMN_083559 [Dreissena polymorpha]
MSSSRKSFIDRFTSDSKQKPPGSRKSKKTKASKSLSRELPKSVQESPDRKKQAQKSSSDTLVADLRKVSEESEASSKIDTKGLCSEVEEKPCDGKNATQKGKYHVPDEEVVYVEKFDPNISATWLRPDTSLLSSCSLSDIDLPVFESPDTKAISTKESRFISTTAILLKHSDSLMSKQSSSHAGLTRTVSSISSCCSTDSLAAEMESYKLDVSRSSSISDVDTLKHPSIGDIDISQCSSTSTPIKFGLFDIDVKEKAHVPIARKPPPKFSLIREVASEEVENLSLSSEFSSSPSAKKFRMRENRNRMEDFSDDIDSYRTKECAELSDDPEFHVPAHFVPLNKQLQIVTSMDKLMDRSHRRRSHSPPKSGDPVHYHLTSRLPFVDFMRCNGLSSYIHYLPADTSLEKFRLLCRQDLIDQYSIVDPMLLERFLKAIRRAREADTTDEEAYYKTYGLSVSVLH